MIFWVLFYWIGGCTALLALIFLVAAFSPWLVIPLGLFLFYAYVCGFNAIIELDMRRL